MTHTAGGVEAYHMVLDPGQQYAWASGIPGGLAKIPLTPFADGTAIPLTGDDVKVTSLAFQDADHAFYTSSGTDGSGNFGTLDLKTFTTHRWQRNRAIRRLCRHQEDRRFRRLRGPTLRRR